MGSRTDLLEAKLINLKLSEENEIVEKLRNLIRGVLYFEEEGDESNLAKIEAEFNDILGALNHQELGISEIERNKILDEFDFFSESIDFYESQNNRILAATILNNEQNIPKDILKLSDLNFEHRQIISLAGIKIQNVNLKDYRILDGDIEDNHDLYRTIISLEDPKKFIEFLKNINSDDLTKKEAIKEGLVKILTSLEFNIVDVFDFENEKGDDNFLEVFSVMNEIISNYERLEINVAKLKEIKTYSDQKILNEYIGVEKLHLLDPFKDNPMNIGMFYDYKIPLEKFHNLFQERINLLYKLLAKKEAKELFEKSVSSFLSTINMMQNDIHQYIMKQSNRGKNEFEGGDYLFYLIYIAGNYLKEVESLEKTLEL